MKNNLQMMKDAIDGTDNDASKSLFFYNNPKARLHFISDVINYSIQAIDNVDNPAELQLRRNELLYWLDQNFQQYAWPAHEVHFHTNFFQHAACTFTCLNEISTILEKLIKDRFAA